MSRVFGITMSTDCKEVLIPLGDCALSCRASVTTHTRRIRYALHDTLAFADAYGRPGAPSPHGQARQPTNPGRMASWHRAIQLVPAEQVIDNCQYEDRL